MTGRSAAGDPRRRAIDAGVRAQELRRRLDAALDGSAELRGSSPEDVRLAEANAARAADRLRRALEASAAAHDRAAAGHEAIALASDDPSGAHARSAAEHRRLADLDRERAAAVEPAAPDLSAPRD